VPPNTILQWHSDVPGAGDDLIGPAVAAGEKVVMSPGNHTYLNTPYLPTPGFGATLSVRSSYAWDPANLLTGVREGDILGVEAALWTEYVNSLTNAEQMLLPRLPGLAELAWSSRRSTWAAYRVRLAAQAATLAVRGDRVLRGPGRSLAEVTSQALQPDPQPPIWLGSVSSATWKEWPQPQDETAFGLSILNPDSWIVSR